ncbi:multiple ankyrin repeats single kh domain-containing protein [Colletotrichum kahawae]|uniref:Multiple ankyrin repeats single kh domain-containing protein n=1 Tax=Colletotrichum kahawae TaxID=34407 RepID=A0AAD9YQQ4_COLKA|nr:multiple ankyrin repeats single kh domain-containing protein [Colletotrichum kahawae]
MLSLAGSNTSKTPLGYFYCANPEFEKARRSCDDVLRTILFQLSIDPSSKTTVKQFLCSEYERQVARSQAGKLDVAKLRAKDCVRLILELAEQDPVTIIIDGIDSVQDEDRHTLVKALGDIVSQADNLAKIFVTSRSSSRAAMIPNSASQIEITPQLVRKDMENFVRHEIDAAVAGKLLLEGNLHLDTREALEDALLDGAGQMFLWVKLQIERLCRETVEDDVISTLRKKLPESMDQLYQNSLDSISRAGGKARDLAMKVLSWVLYMREPLTPRALLATLESGGGTTLDANQLMNTCYNLVLLDTQCNVVRFSHQSVQDFLKDHESFAAGTAHNLLASLCVEACSRGPMAEQPPSIPSDDFYIYAAMYWPVHSKMAQDLCNGGAPSEDASLTRTIISFMFDEDWVTTMAFELWIETLGVIILALERNHEMLPALSAISNNEIGFLFLLSTFGLENPLRIALSQIHSVDVNRANELGCKPVYLASAFGHTNAVAILASYGAELNIECGKFGSPLHAACFNGHLQVVDELLELGAHTACGSTFKNALEAAFRGGQESVAVRLVDSGSSVTNESEYDEAMQGAAFIGFIRVVQLLETSRFKFLRQDNDNKVKMRLMKAVQGGQLGVIRQFLRNTTGKQSLIPPDAVASATLHNHKDLVEFLLDQDMDVEFEGAFGTPLRTAALLDYRPLVCILLEKGADINANSSFGAALQAAALKGHDSIVRLLIEEGANVNQRTGFYGSALQAAAYHGQLGTVELLLDAKADISQAGFSKNAFTAAAASGHPEVIALMLRKGYAYQQHSSLVFSAKQTPPPRYVCLWTKPSPGGQQQHQRSQTNGRPLGHRDSQGSQEPLVDFNVILGGGDAVSEALQSSKRQISQLQGEASQKRCPLQAAALAGHVDTVKFLLERKDNLRISDGEIKLAVEAAAEAGHSSIIQLIVENMKNGNSIESCIRGMVQKGHAAGQPDVVRFGLALASQHLATEESSKLQKMVAPASETYRNTERSKKKLSSNFALSCKTGDLRLLATMLEMGDHKLLSAKDVVLGIHISALSGSIAIAEALLKPPFWQDWMSISGERLFVTAAASGSVAIMKLFVLFWPQLLTTSRTTALSHALRSASEKLSDSQKM